MFGKRKLLGRFFLIVCTSGIINFSFAQTAGAVMLIDGFEGTVGQCNWPESNTSNYAAQIYAGDTSQISSVTLYFQNPTTADFSGAYTSSMKIFYDNSNSVGSLLGSLPFSSVSGSGVTFTGAVSIPSVGKYWIGMATTNSNSISACGSTATPTYSNGWTFGMSGGIYLNGWTQGSTFTYSSHRQMRVVGGPTTVTLATPSAPIITANNGTSIYVSETSTTPNASSYIANVYASNGTTFVESQTISTITSPTLLSALSPLTTYKVGIVAVGDGANYANSAQSNLTTVSTLTSPTTISLSASTLNGSYREIDTLTAVLSGSNGIVTFYLNGKKIPGCQSIASSALSAKCLWRPSRKGSGTIMAALKSSTYGFTNSSSQSINVNVGIRTKLRS